MAGSITTINNLTQKQSYMLTKNATSPAKVLITDISGASGQDSKFTSRHFTWHTLHCSWTHTWAM